MGNRVKQRMLLCLFLITFLVYVCVEQCSQPESKSAVLSADGDMACPPKDHIFFLKAHKCGSTTIQNILIRRGLRRGLNFVLPAFGNYVGNPMFFDPKIHVGYRVRSKYQHFDVFAHHTRYHAGNVAKFMPKDTVKLTVLRDPATQFESLYSYYKFEVNFIHNVTLEQLLEKPTDEAKAIVKKSQRYEGKMGYNQMSFDLGLEPKDFDDEDVLSQFLLRIESEFDLVLMSEHMEASLVLLADLLCWKLQDVAFLSLNSRKHGKVALNEKQMWKIREINKADTELYRYFLKIFQEKIISYGVEKMQNNILELMKLNQQLERECLHVGSKNILENAPVKCEFYMMEENVLTELIRKQQIDRINVVDKFRAFVDNVYN